MPVRLFKKRFLDNNNYNFKNFKGTMRMYKLLNREQGLSQTSK